MLSMTLVLNSNESGKGILARLTIKEVIMMLVRYRKYEGIDWRWFKAIEWKNIFNVSCFVSVKKKWRINNFYSGLPWVTSYWSIHFLRFWTNPFFQRSDIFQCTVISLFFTERITRAVTQLSVTLQAHSTLLTE